MSNEVSRAQVIEATLAGLRQSPPILAGLVGAIPADKLHVRRGEGVWTIAEHVAHLADVQPMLAGRVQRILNEDTPEFVPFFPGEEEADPAPSMSMDQALAAFAEGRQSILRLLDGLDEQAWSRQAQHPEYERYSLGILVRHILMHDHWHMYRVEELWLTRDAYLTRLEG